MAAQKNSPSQPDKREFPRNILAKRAGKLSYPRLRRVPLTSPIFALSYAPSRRNNNFTVMKTACSILVMHVLLVGALSAQKSNKSETTEPKELVALRNNWEKAKEQAIVSVNMKYIEALEALKLRLTKAGDLDRALLVDSEIKSLRSPVGSKQASSSSILATNKDLSDRTLSYVMPSGKWRDKITFNSDGSMRIHRSKMAGNWKIEGGILRIAYGTKWNEFPLEIRDFQGKQVLRETNADNGIQDAVLILSE